MGDPTPFSVSPDGKDALCPGRQGWQVMRYGLDTGQQNNSWSDADSTATVVSVRYSPMGQHWVAVDETGRIAVHGLKSEGRTTLLDPSKSARTALLSTKNALLVSFGTGEEIRVWDL